MDMFYRDWPYFPNDGPCGTSEQLATRRIKRSGPAMTKKSKSSTASKILKLSVPSAKNTVVVEKHLNRKEERDGLQYKVLKAKRAQKKESQLLEEHDKKSREVLNQDLAVIETEKNRWEAMWDHELKATRQRVRELEEKKQDLEAFSKVLYNYRLTGIGESDVLAYMEACKPVI
ncbi:hypothetical protein EG327_009019 [Venturia inaequalis]|uniref:Uncharacterized protein n=1 Tax=Venturia inaequalis TaxID=5025 RepID=A0A8H3YVQ1_VENIN|nr:hypothetical protein EG327_009019 [Venturia inaequalis]